jgi:hypothetical protein
VNVLLYMVATGLLLPLWKHMRRSCALLIMSSVDGSEAIENVNSSESLANSHQV